MTAPLDDFFLTLIKYKISLIEYYVFVSISDALLEKNELAKYTYNRIRGDSRGNFSVQEYAKAIELLLQKGLIKTLTKKDCFRDEERWNHDENQCCSEVRYSEGLIDFSQKGGKLWSELESEVYKISGRIRFSHTALYKWKYIGILSIFTTNLEFMKIQLEKLQLSPRPIFTFDVTITQIGKPYEIKNWWVNRFEQLPSGWRVDIRYQEKQ